MSAESEALAAALDYGRRCDKSIDVLKTDLRKSRSVRHNLERRLAEFERLARGMDTAPCNESQPCEAQMPDRPAEDFAGPWKGRPEETYDPRENSLLGR